MRPWIALCALSLTLVACPKDDEPEPDPEDTFGDVLDLEIPFEARFGAQLFTCGAQVPSQGLTDVTITPLDLKIYLHDVALLTDGDPVPVDLGETTEWHDDGLVLLDFADDSGICSGTPETNTTLIGSVPGGAYTGLTFKIGVPFARNHEPQLDTTPAVLARDDLFINPTDGSRFFKLDMNTTGVTTGWPVYIRSVGCSTNDVGTVESCTAENVLEVTLPGFDPRQGKVTLDLATVLKDSDLSQNAVVTLPGGNPRETEPGCQATPTDPDCQPIYNNYGLGVTAQGWISAE